MEIVERLLPGPVGLDSVVFIYFIEDHPLYAPLLQPLFTAIDDLELPAAASELTLLETLVHPLRQGRTHLAERYMSLLTGSVGLELLPLDRTTLVDAARLRASRRLNTPDALQLAAAGRRGCSCFLTNDRRLPSLPGLRVLQLDELWPRDLVMEPPGPSYG